jgi:hypothetical protein
VTGRGRSRPPATASWFLPSSRRLPRGPSRLLRTDGSPASPRKPRNSGDR